MVRPPVLAGAAILGWNIMELRIAKHVGTPCVVQFDGGDQPIVDHNPRVLVVGVPRIPRNVLAQLKIRELFGLAR